MNRIPAAALVLLFALPLCASNVFVWNYDDEDVFYCDEYGDEVDCAYWIEQTLLYNGHTCSVDTELPSDLSPYDVVFVETGWYRC